VLLPAPVHRKTRRDAPGLSGHPQAGLVDGSIGIHRLPQPAFDPQGVGARGHQDAGEAAAGRSADPDAVAGAGTVEFDFESAVAAAAAPILKGCNFNFDRVSPWGLGTTKEWNEMYTVETIVLIRNSMNCI